MKKLLIAIVLFPSLIRGQAQYINLRIGQLTFSNPMWNTWKTASKANDTSAYLVDILGNKTRIRAVFNNSGTPYDNGINYLTGKGIYPDTVLREGMWQPVGTVCNLSLIGLDTAITYSVILFASRNRTDLQGDTIKILGSSARFAADTNATRTAQFSGLMTKTGQLTFAVSAIAQYEYVNAVQITGIPSHSKAVAVIGIDSTVINYPNSVAHVTGKASIKPFDSAYSWSQVSGASKAIFTNAGDSTYISGLRPGVYKFRLMVNDSSFISDSAFATVTVNPFVCPSCPVCAVCPAPIICPVCPPPVTCPVCPAPPAPRTVVSWSRNLVTGITTITYSDGTTQSFAAP